MKSDILFEKNDDISVGDTILVGRFKNVKAVVKGFGKDKRNQPTVKTNKGKYNLYRFRIQKLMKESKDINLTKQLEDSSNITFVTGVSGSGKTTLTKKIEKTKKYKVIHIDNLLKRYIRKKYTNWKSYDKIKKRKIWQKESNFILSKLLKKLPKNKKYIIEGVQLLYPINYDLIKEHPVIVIWVSKENAIKRRTKRNIENTGKKISSENKSKAYESSKDVVNYHWKFLQEFIKKINHKVIKNQ